MLETPLPEPPDAKASVVGLPMILIKNCCDYNTHCDSISYKCSFEVGMILGKSIESKFLTLIPTFVPTDNYSVYNYEVFLERCRSMMFLNYVGAVLILFLFIGIPVWVIRKSVKFGDKLREVQKLKEAINKKKRFEAAINKHIKPK